MTRGDLAVNTRSRQPSLNRKFPLSLPSRGDALGWLFEERISDQVGNAFMRPVWDADRHLIWCEVCEGLSTRIYTQTGEALRALVYANC